MEQLELTTEKMAFEGRAIARDHRFVVFIEGALPGEKVRVEITQRKRSHAFARLVEVLEPSPHRINAPCPVFGECGGCSFQQADYPSQLAMKRDVLIESLYGVPGVPGIVAPPVGADSPFHFRNKMVFAFGLPVAAVSDRRDSRPVTSATGGRRYSDSSELVLGLHRKGDWQSIVPADACLLQSKESNEILRRMLAFAREHGVPVFDEKAGTGLLRHLVIREGKHTGERMIHLHAAGAHPSFEKLPAALGGLCTTLLVSYHKDVPEHAPADATFTLTGTGQISETLNGFRFAIGPSTFFQTNTLQAEKLFRIVSDWASAVHPKNAVDLYAGTGPIAIHLAGAAERVVAIESVAASVEMARRNIETNGLKNVELLCAEAEKAGIRAFPVPTDLVVVDPPRAGLHKKAVELLLSVACPNLIYVSCNPATLARDLKLLVEGGYKVEAIQPVDLFPHTFHIEAVARLSSSRGSGTAAAYAAATDRVLGDNPVAAA